MTDVNLAIGEWMVGWSPDEGPAAVEVGPWPDGTLWSADFENTTGCCNLEYSQLTDDQKIAQMFVHFHELVIGDRMDPRAVHREFLKIVKFRHHIIPGLEGSEWQGYWPAGEAADGTPR